MHTTVNLDDDVLLAVRERARREKRSAGQVLSDLARAGLAGQRHSERPVPDHPGQDGRPVLANLPKWHERRAGLVERVEAVMTERGIPLP